MSQNVHTEPGADRGWRQILPRINLISLGLLFDLLLFAPPLLLMLQAPQHAAWANGLLAAAVVARLALLALALGLKLKRLALGLVITILLSPAGLLLAPLALGILCGPNPNFFSGLQRRSPPPPPPLTAPFQTTLRLTDQDGISLAGVPVSIVLFTDKGNEPGKKLESVSGDDGMITLDTRPVAYHRAELKTPDHPAPDGWYYQNPDNWRFTLDEKKGWTLYGDREEQKETASRWQTASLLNLVMTKGEPPDLMLQRRSTLHAPYQDALTIAYDVIADEWREGDCPGCDFTLRIAGCESQCGAQQQYDARRMRVTVTAGPGGGILPFGSAQRAEWPERVPESELVRQADFVANNCNLNGRGFLFTSQAGKLNGRVGLNLNCPYHNRGNTPDKPPEWGSIELIANPRGSRNLRVPQDAYGSRLSEPGRPFRRDKHLDLERVRVTLSGDTWVIRGMAGAANRGTEVSAPESSYDKVNPDGSFEISTPRKPETRLRIRYDWPRDCNSDCDQEWYPVVWLPGARGTDSGAVVPVNRAGEYLPLTADSVCPAGRELANAKKVICCWPGQQATGYRCTGTPHRCPSGLFPEDNLCAGAWAYIPPGEFWMGCVPQDRECGKDESPRHRVRISRGFWMMRHFPSNRQMNSAHPDDALTDLPAGTMDFEQAESYCEKLGGRLPTEAEWEYAARGGTDTIYPAGDQLSFDPEKFSDLRGFVNGNHLAPVDWGPPNGFGLLDMVGNNPVWLSDFYAPDYYSHSPVADPAGPQPSERNPPRSVRGTTYYGNRDSFRLSRRHHVRSGEDLANVRCVRDTPPADLNRLQP